MRPRQPTIGRRLALVVTAAVMAGACGNEGARGTDCDDVVTEALDPASSVHLLPGAPEPAYLTDPPTSGPHLSAGPVSGAVDEPLDGPAQIAVLEAGGVLIQYRPDEVSAPERDQLVGLAEDGVVVAPGPGLADPVITTAWLTKQRCSGVSLDTLRTFITDHGSQGPAPDG